MIRKSARILWRTLLFTAQAAAIVFVTLVLAGAFAARQGPGLEAWHTEALEADFRAGQGVESLQAYLELEGRLFAELDRRINTELRSADSDELNRYRRGSPSYPDRGGLNRNRSQQLEPDRLAGGVLMLHGMTDSPYSMRHLAELYRERGFHVLNLRMPGHGTTPGELARVDWRDWNAAVRLGARDVASRLSPGQPFHVVGYSNGGSLALKYALDSLDGEDLARPDRLVLISPMLGVSGLARFGRIFYWLSKLSFFETSAWSSVVPEYDPHKYNSFPMNGARQSIALTGALNSRLQQLAGAGRLGELPPVLTLQSLVDSTVITRDIVTRLYDRLPDNGSELVLFDVNRQGVLEYFVGPQHDALLARLEASPDGDYRYTLVTNVHNRSPWVEARVREAGSLETGVQPLELAWPEKQFSLSHVALPFPPDDPVYGFLPGNDDIGFPPLGRAQMLGESGALLLPATLFTRLRSNPFYEYLERRVAALVDEDLAAVGDRVAGAGASGGHAEDLDQL